MTIKQTIKLVFHKDTFAFIASLVFLWFSISTLADSNFNKKNLTPHTGQLVKIDSAITRVKNKPLFKEITMELRLTLDSERGYFTTITTKNLGDITSKIKIGDKVTIFTKCKLWGMFGFKKPKDICHFTKGANVIIDFEKYKQTLSGLYVLTLIASLGFFIFYYVRTRKRYIFFIRAINH
jgi:hypothetical protein